MNESVRYIVSGCFLQAPGPVHPGERHFFAGKMRGVTPKMMRPPLFLEVLPGRFLAYRTRFVAGHMCRFYGEGRGESCGRGGRDRGTFMARAGLVKNGVTPLPFSQFFGGAVREFSDVEMRGVWA